MNDEEKTREELLKELQWLRYSLETIKTKEEDYNKLEDERTKYEELVHVLLNSNPATILNIFLLVMYF